VYEFYGIQTEKNGSGFEFQGLTITCHELIKPLGQPEVLHCLLMFDASPSEMRLLFYIIAFDSGDESANI
jgi:hypothetical protein